MFYSGPQFVTRGHAFRLFDWAEAKGLVDGFMATYDLPGAEQPDDRKSAAAD